LVPAPLHDTGQYETKRVECDHGRLKFRLNRMRGLENHQTASVVIRGHASSRVYAAHTTSSQSTSAQLFRLATAFDELRPVI
jgi:transposase-like protein